jgi:hypothetical protein
MQLQLCKPQQLLQTAKCRLPELLQCPLMLLKLLQLCPFMLQLLWLWLHVQWAKQQPLQPCQSRQAS